jgi:hypothetical protein
VIRRHNHHKAGATITRVRDTYVFSAAWLRARAPTSVRELAKVRVLVEPIDVSNAILYFVSDDGRCVTGIVSPVDAGIVNKR